MYLTANLGRHNDTDFYVRSCICQFISSFMSCNNKKACFTYAVCSFIQGVNIYITIWDFDPENQFLKYDMVDEFSYDFTDLPGTSGKNLIISGIRPVEKSK